MTLLEFMRQCEQEYIRELLYKHAGNVRAAAIEADCNRTHVYRILHRGNTKPRRSLHRRRPGNETWQALSAQEVAT